MTTLSIFTSMTNPELRNDPWKEALECYKYFADEVVIVERTGHMIFPGITSVKHFKKGLISQIQIGS